MCNFTTTLSRGKIFFKNRIEREIEKMGKIGKNNPNY